MNNFSNKYISKSVLNGIGRFDNFLTEGKHKDFMKLLLALGGALGQQRSEESKTQRQAAAIAALQRRAELRAKEKGIEARAQRDINAAELAAAQAAAVRAEVGTNKDESKALAIANQTAQGQTPDPPPSNDDIKKVEAENFAAAKAATQILDALRNEAQRNINPEREYIDVKPSASSTETVAKPGTPNKKRKQRRNNVDGEIPSDLFAGVDPSKGIPSSYNPPANAAEVVAKVARDNTPDVDNLGGEKPKNRRARGKGKLPATPPSKVNLEQPSSPVLGKAKKKNQPPASSAAAPSPVAKPEPESKLVTPREVGQAVVQGLGKAKRKNQPSASSSTTPPATPPATPPSKVNLEQPSSPVLGKAKKKNQPPASSAAAPPATPPATSPATPPAASISNKPSNQSSKRTSRSDTDAMLLAMALKGMSRQERELGRGSRDPSPEQIDDAAKQIRAQRANKK